MRVLLQRVTQASVTIDGEISGAIGSGLLVLVGIEEADTEEDARWLSRKIVQMRLFDDASGVINLSLAETGGDLLLISHFTLHAQTRKGNRPSYIKAAKPDKAVPLYEFFIRSLQEELGKPVATGVFGADMQVALINDGPVTIWIDSRNKE